MISIRFFSLLIILSNCLISEDIYLLSAEAQSDKDRAFITCRRLGSAGAFTSNIHLDQSTWSPRSIEYYSDLALVVMAGDGPSGALITLRSMLFPCLSAAYTDKGMAPLGAKLIRTNEIDWGFFYARILPSGSGSEQEVSYQLMQLTDNQPEIFPVSSDLPLHKMINLGSTVQQGLPGSMELQLVGAKYASVIGPEQRAYPAKLELPLALQSLMASGSMIGTIWWCGATGYGSHLLVAKRKDDSYIFFMAGVDPSPFIDRKDKFGGLRLIRDWVYIQDFAMTERAPTDNAKRKFIHSFWRPKDGRMLDVTMMGDAEVLDIVESKICLVRLGNRVLVGKFDAEKAGPIPTDLVYEGPYANSVHWGSVSNKK